MKLLKGTHRYVWLIGPLAFKFPRIDAMLSSLWEDILCANFVAKSIFVTEDRGIEVRKSVTGLKHLIRFVILSLKYCRTSVQYRSGIMENWREAVCYYQTKHHLLAGLLCPLIVVNIYRRYIGAGNIDDYLLYRKIVDAIGVADAVNYDCWHTFDSADNFASNGSEVKILDYGEYSMRELLSKHGDKVENVLLSSIVKRSI